MHSTRADQDVPLITPHARLFQEHSRIVQRFPAFAVGLRWSASPPSSR